MNEREPLRRITRLTKHDGWPFSTENFMGTFVEIRAEDYDALVTAASELTRYLGHGGSPDLRNLVARLDVALEALGDA